jgi:hypothetical protein
VLARLPNEVRFSFRRLTVQERHWRGRVWAMTWVIFGDEAFAWFAALAEDEDFVASMRRFTSEVTDADILRALDVRPPKP